MKPRFGWQLLICFAGGLGLAAALSLAWWFSLKASRPAPEVFDLVIPAGTADRIAQGEAPPALPANLSLRQGDKLLVRNEDVVVHRIGPVAVEPGSTAELPISGLATSNRFVCSFHVGGSIDLTVIQDSAARSLTLPTLIIGLPLGAVAYVVLRVANGLDAGKRLAA